MLNLSEDHPEDSPVRVTLGDTAIPFTVFRTDIGKVLNTDGVTGVFTFVLFGGMTTMLYALIGSVTLHPFIS